MFPSNLGVPVSTLHRRRPTAAVTLRSLADALGKIAARLSNSDEFDSVPVKACINECGGQLLELANRFPEGRETKPVSIQVQEDQP
jgi:hypothetical protein